MINRLSFFIGLRYSFSRKQSHLVAFISRISTAGMVLAVSLLILVTSVMNGFDKALKENIIGIVPHVTLASDEPITDWKELIRRAEQHPEVESASPFSYFQGMFVHDEKVRPALLYAFNADEEPEGAVMTRLLSSLDFQGFNHANQLVLGQGLADKLGVGVGDQLPFIASKGSQVGSETHLFEIVQLIKTGTQLDQRIALTDRQTLAAIQGFENKNAVNGIRLYLKDIFKAFVVANDLRFALNLYDVNDWTTSQGNLYQAVQMSRKMVIFLVFIIVAVAAFNLVSTLILAVNDKASDIAILRTLGCTKSQVLGIFLLQGGAIGLVGLVIGVVFGVLLSLGISDMVKWLEFVFHTKFLETEIYPVDYLPVDIRLQDVFIIGGLALSLSLVASILPAIRAASLKPAKILRYE